MKMLFKDPKTLAKTMESVMKEDIKRLSSISGVNIVYGIPKGVNSEGESIEEYAKLVHDGSYSKMIPSRPFLRTVKSKYSERISQDLKKGLLEIKDEQINTGKMDFNSVKRIIEKQVALPLENYVKDNILNGGWKANAQATIEKKGSSRPLIDEGSMIGSVTARVVRK